LDQVSGKGGLENQLGNYSKVVPLRGNSRISTEDFQERNRRIKDQTFGNFWEGLFFLGGFPRIGKVIIPFRG